MANKKISELNQVASVNDNQEYLINNNGVSNKVKYSQIKTDIANQGAEDARDLTGLTAKTTPVDNDLLLINDSADSDNPKKVTTGNMVDNRIIPDVRADIVKSGAGAPAITPDFVGQRYVDTTAKRWYCATGTSGSADWDKEAVFKSGTETVTGGSGDVTVTLPWDWTGGHLTVIISRATTDWCDATSSRDVKCETSYDALTAGGYSAGHMIRYMNAPNTAANNVLDEAKTTNRPGIPKSATTTSFTLDDDGSTTVYIKWFVIA